MEVRLIDRIVLAPGALEDFRRRFEDDYLPAAQSRGMELLERWVCPPVEVDGEPSELTLVWRVDGPTGFFAMRTDVQRHAEVASFWASCSSLIRDRHRAVSGAW